MTCTLQVQHLVRQLAEQVVDLPLLQWELRELRPEVVMAEERVRTAMEAVESLLSERGDTPSKAGCMNSPWPSYPGLRTG